MDNMVERLLINHSFGVALALMDKVIKKLVHVTHEIPRWPWGVPLYLLLAKIKERRIIRDIKTWIKI